MQHAADLEKYFSIYLLDNITNKRIKNAMKLQSKPPIIILLSEPFPWEDFPITYLVLGRLLTELLV